MYKRVTFKVSDIYVKPPQATYRPGLFEKNPGFASEGRQTQQRLTKQDVDDIYFHDGKES